MAGAALLPAGMFRNIGKIAHAFRTGHGVEWAEQDPAIFASTERFWQVSYRASLISEWIPAIDGMQARLKAGASVADIGCGHGAALILMTREFPHGLGSQAGEARLRALLAEAGYSHIRRAAEDQFNMVLDARP
jgi:hypothetical protein